jgi:hypothetical protein
MVDWDPQDYMGKSEYIRFQQGKWVEVDTVPDWVYDASNPPDKTDIPVNGSVSAIFTGNSLEYKIITKRLPRGAGTYLEPEYQVRIKDV